MRKFKRDQLTKKKIGKFLFTGVLFSFIVYFFRNGFPRFGLGNVTEIGAKAGNLKSLREAKANLTSERKTFLLALSDKTYQSMEGFGTYYNDFVRYMISIENDYEFIYFVSVFGKKGGFNFFEWYSDETALSGSVLDIVNNDYSSKGMTNRL